MCEPMTVAAIAMAGASMASTYMANEKQNKTAEVEADAANMAAKEDYVLLGDKENQMSEQSSLEALERMRQGRRERAKIRVATGESGVAGLTPIRLLANSFLQESFDTGIMKENLENNLSSVEAEKRKVYTDNSSRNNAANSKVISPFMSGLQIAGGGLSTGASVYAAGKYMKSTKPTAAPIS